MCDDQENYDEDEPTFRKLLYCPVCSAYLEGGDGELHDCCACGWRQPGASS